MIFAALALRCEEAVARLDRVRAALPGQPVVLRDGGACLAVWPSEERAAIDDRLLCASAGPFHGNLREGHARGCFAAVQLDEGGLLVARGRVGGRAMYWAREGSVVLASTRLPVLVRALDARPALDAMRLAELAAGDMHARPSATSFTGVQRLVSGQLLRVGAGGAVTSTTLPPPSLSPLTGKPDELAHALRDEIFATVRRSIDGLGRVAVLAGGGVDSSALLAAVVALVRGGTAKEVLALSLHFAGRGDDRPYMNELAKALGLLPVRVSPGTFARFVGPSLVVDGQPYASPMGGWELGFLDLAREKGADVLLSGTGGDELFDGDPRCFALQALRGHFVSAARAAVRLRVPWTSSRLQRLYEFVLRPIAVHAVPRQIRRVVRRRRVGSRGVPWAGPLIREVLRRPMPEPVGDFGPRTPTEFFTRISDSKWALEVSEAQCSIDAQAGCATRTPFRDEALISFVARLPAESLLRGGYLRGLFREAFAGLVPERVRLRTDKADFETAIEDMHAPIGGRGAFPELASLRALEGLGVVRSAAFRQSFDAFIRGEIDHEGWHSLWPLLSLEAFARQALEAA